MDTEDDDLGGKPLIEAVRDEDHSRIEKLLSKDDKIIRRYINDQDEDGSTALHLSIGNQKLVTKLLKKKADPNVKNLAGQTPLHIAAKMDLMETVILLILHEAKVQEDKESGNAVTPATVAAKAKSKGCLQILLFCGAKFPKLVVQESKDQNSAKQTDYEIVDPEEQENYDRILQGFRDRKIEYAGMHLLPQEMVKEKGQEGEKKLGVAFNMHIVSRETMFLFRRMDISYQDSNPANIPMIESETGESLISSVYQFRVSSESVCDISVDITIEVTSKIKKYEDIALIQVVQDKDDFKVQYRKITNSTSTDGKQAKFSAVTLYPNPSGGFTAMGVYRKNKKQEVEVKESQENQTFKSDVDKKFAANFSPTSLSGVTEVEIEVHSVDTKLVLNRETKTSNFCSIAPKESEDKRETSKSPPEPSRAKNKIDLSMPKMDAEDSNNLSIHVVVCPTGESPENGCSWKAAEGELKENSQNETVSVEGQKIGFGRYIVLAVNKVAKFGYSMMLMVQDLYMRASGTTARCVLFAAVKLKNRYEYLVLVTFCERDKMEEEKQELLSENYVMKKISCIYIEVNTKRTYHIDLEVKDGKSYPKEYLPIQYQHNNPKYHTYTVTSEQYRTPGGYMKVFKKPVKENRNKNNQTQWMFPISFDTKRRVERKIFPSDELISNLAGTIGKDYFPVGIYVGIPAEYLQLLDYIEAVERSLEVLYQWRTQYFPDEQLEPSALSKSGLSKLVVSFLMSGRHDTLNKLVADFRRDESSDCWRAWFDEFRVGKDRFSFKELLRQQKLNPFEDVFLYKAATKIFVHVHILMELKVENADAILKQSQTPERNAFEVLLRARRKDNTYPPVKSLEKLVNCIRDNKDNLAVRELGNVVKPWHTDMTERLKTRNLENPYSQDVLNKVKHIFRDFKLYLCYRIINQEQLRDLGPRPLPQTDSST